MRILFAMLLFIANLSTTAVLFSGASLKPSAIRGSAASSVNIKWGEGSEAGAPDGTTRN